MMASGNIRISPEVMRQRAGEYTTEAGKLEDIIRTMDRLLQQLQSEWEGDSSAAYVQRYTELKPGFQKAKDLIDEISNALKSTANIMERTDSEIGNQFRA